MTTEEFNDLPLSARQFIEKEKGCLSCGSSQDVDSLYKKYLIMQKKALFTLRTGAVSYKTESGAHGVLYPVHPKDSEEAVNEKLQKALLVYESAPGRFKDIDVDKIKAKLAEEPTEPAEPAEPAAEAAAAEAAAEEPAVKQLHGAAKKAAEAKAAKDAGDLD